LIHENRFMSLPATLFSLWERLPFRAMALLTALLLFLKEEFPFSNFPMYANFDEEADVVFVTDQNNAPVAMEPLFGTGSAGTKKRYEAELASLCNKAKRDTEHSTPEERKQAGATELAGLVKRLKRKVLPAGVTELRFHLRTFAYDEAQGRVNIDRPAEHLASQSL
jgi:hypothetical protein